MRYFSIDIVPHPNNFVDLRISRVGERSGLSLDATSRTTKSIVGSVWQADWAILSSFNTYSIELFYAVSGSTAANALRSKPLATTTSGTITGAALWSSNQSHDHRQL